MLEINDLNIKIDDRYLVKNLSFTLNYGDKLAIIGEEGNGKSTLLKAILGNCEYANIEGSINLHNNRIGYLEQVINNKYLDYKVFDYLFKNLNTYYDNITYFYKYLDLIKLDDTILDKKIKNLSGGEKVKISLIKLLINKYDILFLDEPSNDLDLETLIFLEDFINNTNKPIIYISYDETLLARTANMILHLEQTMKKTDCRTTILKVDYDTYVNLRLKRIEKETSVAKNEKREFLKRQEKLQKIMDKVAYKQNTVSRKDPFIAKGLKVKMHALKSQEKKLENMKLTKIPDVEESINFFFENVFISKTKTIIDLELKELKIQDKVLAKNIKLNIIGPKHICIIGKNGCGKSTLIKLIYNILKDKNDLKVGYMPQNYDDILNNFKTPIDFLATDYSKDEITKIRMFLGNMHFTKDEMTGSINNLSMGSKAKLFLIKLVLTNCNVLLLDEPTRNLSPLSNPIIRKVLKEFTGTIISVSHDRKYITNVIDDLYILTENGLIKIRLDC